VSHFYPFVERVRAVSPRGSKGSRQCLRGPPSSLISSRRYSTLRRSNRRAISHMMSLQGQTEKYSQRAHVFRVAPIDGVIAARLMSTPPRERRHRGRVSARGRALACDPHDAQRPASIATAFRPARRRPSSCDRQQRRRRARRNAYCGRIGDPRRPSCGAKTADHCSGLNRISVDAIERLAKPQWDPRKPKM
jgi:hypothetical protein